MKCHHCGNLMSEQEVFCSNCWKITPNIQEMLNKHPDRTPKDYFVHDSGYKERCPHCKTLYSKHSKNSINQKYGTPIVYCSNCHDYFLDTLYFEWSVCFFGFKFMRFFHFALWALVVSLLFGIAMVTEFSWSVLIDISIYTACHFVFCLVWHHTVCKKEVYSSYQRLEQNNEYPKILIDMGYKPMMSKKFHTLSKEPPLTRKDQLKEILKEAFSFDKTHP